MTGEAFARYLVSWPSAMWWEQSAKPFLETKGWFVIPTANFDYESSYGFESDYLHPGFKLEFGYCLNNASAVIEYRGEVTADSIFYPGYNRTLIDDVLAYMSLYSGIYCQYLWKERRDSASEWSATTQLKVKRDAHSDEWVTGHRKALDHFEKAQSVIPTLNETQFNLAIHWYFSALREFEMGRPLVEAALNWVCLESQANYLKFQGYKKDMVKSLLKCQGFSVIPRIDEIYKLRNDAFHEGQLSNLKEQDAQSARRTGRILVRAYILNLIPS